MVNVYMSIVGCWEGVCKEKITDGFCGPWLAELAGLTILLEWGGVLC
jgi:hypothetical protein